MNKRKFYIGVQNDQLYIVSGEKPIMTDYPNHDADRTCVAKVFDEAEATRLIELQSTIDQQAAQIEMLREAMKRIADIVTQDFNAAPPALKPPSGMEY